MTTLLNSTVALDGDAIEHAGITDTSLEALIASAKASYAALLAAEDAADTIPAHPNAKAAVETADAVDDEATAALSQCIVTTPADILAKTAALAEVDANHKVRIAIFTADIARWLAGERHGVSQLIQERIEQFHASHKAFEAAWDEARRQEQIDSDAAQDIATEAESRAIDAARDALAELLSTPVRSQADADLKRAFSLAHEDDYLSPENMLRAAMNTPIAAAPQSDAFEMATAEFGQAKRRVAVARQILDDVTAKVEADAPRPDELRRPQGGYHNDQTLMRDGSLTPARRRELFQVFLDWRAKEEEAQERHGFWKANDRWENLDTDSELLRLSKATSPDLAGIAFVLHAWLESVHLSAYATLDTPEALSSILSEEDWDDGAFLARIYQNVLALLGERPDLVAAKPFDPAAWVKEFQSHPGHTINAIGPSYLEETAWAPGTFGKGEPTGHYLWAGLARWQKDKVLNFAKTLADQASGWEQFLAGRVHSDPEFTEQIKEAGRDARDMGRDVSWFVRRCQKGIAIATLPDVGEIQPASVEA